MDANILIHLSTTCDGRAVGYLDIDEKVTKSKCKRPFLEWNRLARAHQHPKTNCDPNHSRPSTTLFYAKFALLVGYKRDLSESLKRCDIYQDQLSPLLWDKKKRRRRKDNLRT